MRGNLRGLATALAVGLSGSAWAAPVSEAPVRRALVVGVNDGGTDLEQLRYAEKDAARMADVLGQLGEFGREGVTLVFPASVAELEVSIAAIGAEFGESGDGMFLFYYSGHADARGLRIGDDVYRYTDLKQHIRAIDAGVNLGILDACRSGAITRIKGATVAEPFLVVRPVQAEGEAWIAASSADEDAQESDRLGGSFFTHYLVSGLRGAADTGDGSVSLSEAYAYAYARTVARTAGTVAGPQHPEYEFQMQGNGDLVLTDVARAEAWLEFDAVEQGTISVVRAADMTPIAEVVKLGGRASRLAVAPGRYVLRNRIEGVVREVTVDVSAGAVVPIGAWGESVVESGTAKGDDDEVVSVRSLHPLALFSEKMAEASRSIATGLGHVSVPRIRLGGHPGIAGTMSVIVPGSGQMYGGRWGQGTLFLAAVGGLSATGWVAAWEERPAYYNGVTGPNPLTTLGLAVYGWAIMDAVYGLHQRDPFRPKTGWTLSMGTGWSYDFMSPATTGVALDYHFHKNFSVGLDRIGYIQGIDAGELSWGGRATAGLVESNRLRLAVLVALGSRVRIVDTGFDVEATQAVAVGGGLQARFYATPRYFLEYEGRAELAEGEVRPLNTLGFGVHFGGGVEREAKKKRGKKAAEAGAAPEAPNASPAVPVPPVPPDPVPPLAPVDPTAPN